MIERTVIGLMSLAFTSLVLPFIGQYMDPLLTTTTIFDRQNDLNSLSKQNQDTTFDYIIVGAGSSGAILATRLAEDYSIHVLLLEAGGEPSPIMAIPTMAFGLQNKKSFDWAYRTVPQENASLGLNNRVSHWPAGKVLGGSSGINAQIYLRGKVQGFDLIADRTKDPIWKTQNIMKFYKKIENYNGIHKNSEALSESRGHSSEHSSHGVDGDLYIEKSPLVPMTEHFLEAAKEVGYEIRDPNGSNKQGEGFSPADLYTKNGVRGDAYRRTLAGAKNRGNLVVRKYSQVTKLVFSSETTNEVVGVEYERHGKTYVAKAKRETILCSGALGSAKILMLSGIGPKAHLEDLKIPVRANLPVGQRLQDKYGALIGPFLVKPGYSFNELRDINLTSISDWVKNGKGLLGSGRLEVSYGILSESAKTSQKPVSPDIHSYLISQTPVNPKFLFGDVFNFNPKVLEYLEKSTHYGDGFFQLVTLNRAVGIGTVELKDKNPHSPLLIDPKYLQNPNDVNILVEGINFAVNLVENTTAMKEIGAHLFKFPYPGCESHTFKSDAYYECLARHATFTAYKYCGTASIGAQDDPEAVVDSKFRVYQTERLRVIDGSLFRADEVSTNDVTMRMVGELAAELFKTSWNEL